MNRSIYLAPVAAILLLTSFPCATRAAPFIRSDFNQSGTLDVADPVAIARYLFVRGESPGCLDDDPRNRTTDWGASQPETE